MISRKHGSLEYYQFEIFEGFPLIQGVFTRRGGVSPPPWDSLNIGGTVGDQAGRVAENKRRLLDALGVEPRSTYEVWQVHSARVVKADSPLDSLQNIHKADAVISDQPELILLMRFADCVPIYLYDPVQRAVGLVHAGWQGTVKRAAGAAVRAMEQHFGSAPQELLAGIGPSIGPDHYQVGDEVYEAFRTSFGSRADELFVDQGGLVKLDLWEANQLDLQQAGVNQVEVGRICTACHLDEWYSHRAERGKTGRFGAVFGLKDAKGDG
jgi:hypothetical protein